MSRTEEERSELLRGIACSDAVIDAATGLPVLPQGFAWRIAAGTGLFAGGATVTLLPAELFEDGLELVSRSVTKEGLAEDAVARVAYEAFLSARRLARRAVAASSPLAPLPSPLMAEAVDQVVYSLLSRMDYGSDVLSEALVEKGLEDAESTRSLLDEAVQDRIAAHLKAMAASLPDYMRDDLVQDILHLGE